jgi:diguanylate cyclase (GGDEF)-like protein/PAS domain S-box-containing protein
MSDGRRGAFRGLSRAASDLIIIGAATVGALVLVRLLEASGRIDLLVERVGVLGLHYVFITSSVLFVALAIYSVRRWRESRAELQRRLEAEAELQRHQGSLEDEVERRTSALRKINEELEQEIAERRQAEGAASESEKFLDTIFHSIRDPFSIIDGDFRIVRVNEAYSQMRELPPDELLGKRCHEILREKDIVCDDCIVEKTFVSGDPCAKEKPCSTHEGMWVEIFTYPISLNGGGVTHVIEYIRDITGRKRSEEEHVKLIKKLEHISSTDGLTGLLNRRAIIDALGREVERSRRYGSELSVLLCDIDYFKETNDAFGHEAGDQALVMVAGALCGISRDSDLIGRYGGDEFMLVLPDTGVEGGRAMAEKIGTEIKDTLVEPPEAGAFNVTLSIGVAGFNPERDDPETLIRRADKGMYASKHAGRNNITVDS